MMLSVHYMILFPGSGTYMLNVVTVRGLWFAIAGNDGVTTLIRFIL